MSFQGRGRRTPGSGRRGTQGTGSNRGRYSGSSRGHNARSNDDVNALSASLTSLHLRYSNPSRLQNQSGSNQVPETLRIHSQSVTPGPTARTISVKEIDDYVQQIVDSAASSEVELDIKKEICMRLQSIVRRVVPDADLKMMGGTANTFALKDSDVDVCIVSAGELGTSQLEELAKEFIRAGRRPF
jgi:DNA polymerase sigma